MPDMSKFELENMLDDGLACMRAYPHITPQKGESGGEEDDFTWVRVSSLIAGSDTFRNTILKLYTDPIYCALFDTKLADLVSMADLKRLSKGGRLVEASRIGSIVYSSKKCEMEWFVLISGKLKVNLDANICDPSDQAVHEIIEGNMFGGCGLLAEEENRRPFEIEVIQPCTFVELSGEHLKTLVDENEHSGMLVLSFLGLFYNLFGTKDASDDYVMCCRQCLEKTL